MALVHEALSPWERRQAYQRCRALGHHSSAGGICEHCGSQLEVRTIEVRVPPRVLCPLDHHKGVACPNEPECSW
jgi:hypothetical protein